jgi:hypothetical protein
MTCLEKNNKRIVDIYVRGQKIELAVLQLLSIICHAHANQEALLCGNATLELLITHMIQSSRMGTVMLLTVLL